MFQDIENKKILIPETWISLTTFFLKEGKENTSFFKEKKMKYAD